MPRPRKWRRVCCLPEASLFGPLKRAPQGKEIVMSVEEYETIRLLDLEGLTQEEAADHMNVARTTVQRMYADARKKVAEALFYGSILRIEGGDYRLYDESERGVGFKRCRRHRGGRHGRGRDWFDEDRDSNS
ncbi:MAG: DUF134 domain-containing protein [Firmicutes bacterium]|nr:DUF134 domain-containing protein [Bacillota bacterium]